MKHLRHINESIELTQEIQDILNIARDEDVRVISCPMGTMGKHIVWMYRLPFSNRGVMYGEAPHMDNIRYIEMVKGIYDRLDNEGLIVIKVGENDFYGGESRLTSQVDEWSLPITADIPEGYTTGYARMLIDNRA